MTFIERYVGFINDLESINQHHDELTDTDVRERLREVINYYLIYGNLVDSEFPQRFSMFTPEGDKQVFEATHSFIKDALSTKEIKETELGQSRHLLIENETVVSLKGNAYWLFLGCADDVWPMEKPKPDALYQYDYDEN